MRKSTKTLVILQQESAEEIIALPENGRRAAGYKLTFLNRQTRGLHRIHTEFIRWAKRNEYSDRLIAHCWNDILDYTRLLALASRFSVD